MTFFGVGGVSPLLFSSGLFFFGLGWVFFVVAVGVFFCLFGFFYQFPSQFCGKIKLIPANYQMMAVNHFCDFYHLSSVRSKRSTKCVRIFWLQKLVLKAKQNKKIVRLKLQKLCQSHKNHRAPFKLLLIQLLPNRFLDRGNRIFMPPNPFVIASKYTEAHFTTITVSVCPAACCLEL